MREQGSCRRVSAGAEQLAACLQVRKHERGHELAVVAGNDDILCEAGGLGENSRA
jgi:hypothetical protein